MKADEVKRVLKMHKVNNLYHVNTVVTSLTFLKNKGLMSREYVENMGLPQSPQESDESDKEWKIYNDVFFDSVDIHKRIRNINYYGPVTFVYSVDLLDSLNEYEINVTKDNPVYWKEGSKTEDNYFTDADELENGFTKGAFYQHITIKNIEKVPFNYLEKIIIENPGEDKKEYLDNAVTAIKNVIEEKQLNILLEIRNCTDSCNCLNTYNSHQDGFTYHRFKTSLN